MNKLNHEEFNEIFESTKNFIKPGETNAWIGRSSLITRAYYWGLINGLKSFTSVDDLKEVYTKLLFDTMYSTEIDNTIQNSLEKSSKHTD
jgi:hypothetical protein